MAGKLSCVTGPGVVDASSKSSFEGMVSELSCGGRELTLQDVPEAETRLWRRAATSAMVFDQHPAGEVECKPIDEQHTCNTTIQESLQSAVSPPFWHSVIDSKPWRRCKSASSLESLTEDATNPERTLVRPAKPCQANPSRGISVSLMLRDLEDLQLEVYVRDACD
jgi:hypothetical protein